MTKTILLLSMMGSAAFGQTVINGGRTIKGDWDASTATTTKPAKTGAALPAACSTGEVFFNSGAAGGQNLYVCSPDNNWSQISGGGGTGVIGKLLVFDGATMISGESMTAWSCGSGSGAVCTTNWTAPAGLTAVNVTAWSAGGGGGGSRSGDRSGPGGGGGGYFQGVCPVIAGNTYTITVGVGGIGSNDGYTAAGSGGSSGLASCFSILGGQGGNGATGANFGGYLANSNNSFGWTSINGGVVISTTACVFSGTAGNALRSDGGGCGAGVQVTSGLAGNPGGSAAWGGGGGGSGAYNHATGGSGGTSGYGGTGGSGGAWTAGGGLVACVNGSIPGGGGGSAAATSAGNGNKTGCNGARGELRMYYAK